MKKKEKLVIRVPALPNNVKCVLPHRDNNERRGPPASQQPGGEAEKD